MRNPHPRLLKILRMLTFSLLGLVVLYIGFVLVVPKISVNTSAAVSEGELVDIYILTNGVHTDIVMPIESDGHDWRPFVGPLDTKAKDESARYAAFGWGDKGFYLDTPTWADLKFSTAFKAAFWLGTSAMHVTFYTELKENERCKKISISKDDYLKMVAFIKSSFKISDRDKPVLLENASYDQYDAFYDGIGTYNLFFTCNTWANNALKSGNQKACLWAARQEDIFSKYSD